MEVNSGLLIIICQFELILLGEILPFIVRLNLAESLSFLEEIFSLAVPHLFRGLSFILINPLKVIFCGSNSYESSLFLLSFIVMRSLSLLLLGLFTKELLVVKSFGNSFNLSVNVAYEVSLFSD
jgi:hypothetical protein